VPQALKDYISSNSIDAISRVIPYYALLSESYNQTLISDSLALLRKHHAKVKELLGKDDLITFEKFQEHFSKLITGLTSDHFDILKIKYLEFKKALIPGKPSQIMLSSKLLVKDLNTAPHSKK